MARLLLASAAAKSCSLATQVSADLYREWDERDRASADHLIGVVLELRAQLMTVEKLVLSREVTGSANLFRVLEGTNQALIALSVKFVGNEACNSIRLPFESALAVNTCTANLLRSGRMTLHQSLTRSESALSPYASFTSRIWRAKADYERAHARARSTIVSGTGTWLLQDERFTEWSKRFGPCAPLWISGVAGAGKTILTSIVIDHVRRRYEPETHVGIAYFYIQYNVETTTLGIALALLHQLNRQSPSIAEEVLQLEENASVGETELKDVTTVLLSVIARFQRCFIFIDAIDECLDLHVEDTTALFRSMYEAGCRFLVTAPDDHQAMVHKIGEPEQIHIFARDDDIETIIRDRIRSSRGILDITIEGKIIDKVKEMTGRVFSTLNIVFGALGHDWMIEEVMSLHYGTVQPALLYAQVLEHALTGPDSYQCEVARNALAWLYYCRRPLSEDEFVDAVGATNIDTVLRSYSGLLTVTADRIISFANPSVREYIHANIMGRHASASQVTTAVMPLALSEVPIVQRCLRALILCTRRPIYSYAARFWGDHARRASLTSDSEVVNGLVLEFLRDHRAVAASSKLTFATKNPFDFSSGMQNVITDDSFVNNRTQPLHLIAHFGLGDLLTDEIAKSLDIDQPDRLGRTALQLAVSSGFCTETQVLLHHGADPSVRDMSGRNAYHHAVIRGDPDSVGNLINHGFANGEWLTKDELSMTPIDHAAKQGREIILRMLLELGIGLSNRYLQATLAHGLYGRSFSCVKEILGHRARIEPQHLVIAAGLGFDQALELLIDLGADRDQPVTSGLNPVQMTVIGGKVAALHLLWLCQARMEVVDMRGRSLFALAVLSDNVNAVEYLDINSSLSRKVYIDASTSAIEYAERHNLQRMQRILRKHGIDSRTRSYTERLTVKNPTAFNEVDMTSDVSMPDATVKEREGVIQWIVPDERVFKPDDPGPSTLITLDVPIHPSFMPLGTMVVDPLKPFTVYIPDGSSKDSEALAKITKEWSSSARQSKYHFIHRRGPINSFRSLFATQKAMDARFASFTSKFGHHQYLSDVGKVVYAVVTRWGPKVLELAAKYNRIYMVVDRLVLEDPQIEYTGGSDTGIVNAARFESPSPVSISPKDAGGVGSSSKLAEPDPRMFSQMGHSRTYAIRYLQISVVVESGRPNLRIDGYYEAPEIDPVFG